MIIKCIITDLDGTLVDTKKLNFLSYKKAFDEINFELKEKLFFDALGLEYESFVKKIIPNITHNQSKSIRVAKNLYFDEYIKYAELNKSLANFLYLNKVNIPIALATSASKINVNKLLRYFDIADLFKLIITSEDVKRPKPDPECFSKIMKSFNVKPSNTLIFEDSIVGLMAANTSGANVIKIDNWIGNNEV